MCREDNKLFFPDKSTITARRVCRGLHYGWGCPGRRLLMILWTIIYWPFEAVNGDSKFSDLNSLLHFFFFDVVKVFLGLFEVGCMLIWV